MLCNVIILSVLFICVLDVIMGVELELQNFINGEFVSTADYIDSYDPSTGEVWSRVPNSSVAEVDQAVQAAKKAFKTWGKRQTQLTRDIHPRLVQGWTSVVGQHWISLDLMSLVFAGKLMIKIQHFTWCV